MEIDNKMSELQAIESNLQNFLSQRQSLQMEINEIENAVEELKNYNDEIFKMISGMLIKTEKEKITEELKEKKKIIEMRLGAIEKQEKILEKRVEELRKEINSSSSLKAKK
jgi:prefoldin beta subunit